MRWICGLPLIRCLARYSFLPLFYVCITLSLSATSLFGDDRNLLEISNALEERVVIYVLNISTVVLWDVDKSEVLARFVIPPKISNIISLDENDVPGYELIPSKTNGIAHIRFPAKLVCYNTRTNSIISETASPSGWLGNFQKGDRALVLAKDNEKQSVVTYDLETLKETNRWRYTSWAKPSEHVSDISIEEFFHPSGLIAAMVDYPEDRARMERPQRIVISATPKKYVAMWDLKKGRELWRITNRYPTGSIRFSPDAKLILVNSNGMPEIWDAETGKTISQFDNGFENKVFEFGPNLFSPCGKYILFAKEGGGAILWDWRKNLVVQRYDDRNTRKNIHNYGHMFSSDGKRVIMPACDLNVYEYETESGKFIGKKAVMEIPDSDKLDILYYSFR